MNGDYYMRQHFRLVVCLFFVCCFHFFAYFSQDMHTPIIPDNFANLDHTDLRNLAKTHGLKNNRPRDSLVHDLRLLRQGKQSEIPLVNWKGEKLTDIPSFSAGIFLIILLTRFEKCTLFIMFADTFDIADTFFQTSKNSSAPI